jgi:hypothetical protein
VSWIAPGESFVMWRLPATAAGQERGRFLVVGLARVLPPAGRWWRPRDRQVAACALARMPHVHAYSASLDFSPMEQPTLNWPRALSDLAADVGEAAVARLQAELCGFREPEPQVDRWVVHSHGLIWRSGDRLPVSDTYERIHFTLRVVDLIAAHADVATAFGRSLADPDRQVDDFLLACVTAAELDADISELLEGAGDGNHTEAVQALFGRPTNGATRQAIIAIGA